MAAVSSFLRISFLLKLKYMLVKYQDFLVFFFHDPALMFTYNTSSIEKSVHTYMRRSRRWERNLLK